jgi:short subunit dehydrogenase-like uncharacterized protein
LRRENIRLTLLAIEVLNHNLKELETLAKKTKVFISTVGPFALYGTPVVEACVKNGTHYLDVTGEVPWVHDIISQFQTTAQQNGSIVIPQCGFDSVPSDILTYMLVKHARDTHSEGLETAINTIQRVKGEFSGGTIASAIGLSSVYPATYLMKTFRPFALSPVKPAAEQNSSVPAKTLRSSLTGTWNIPELGIVGNWPGTMMDRAIVHRSWGLFDAGSWYGQKFRFTQLLGSKSTMAGAIMSYGMMILQLVMLFPPGRWALSKLAYEPGNGPTREDAKKFYLKMKALATTESGRRLIAKMDLDGCLYHFTGVFVAEAALELLKGGENLATKQKGFVTSACLESGYVDRLLKAPGVRITVEELADKSARL